MFDIVRWSLERGLSGSGAPGAEDTPKPVADILVQPMGAFVTLHCKGRLRGCIGMMQAITPLYLTVAAMAFSAAFQDRRFSPLRREELPDITFDISLLGPLAPCPDIALIELGRHGIMLQARSRSAIFLPQVPVEQGWTLQKTLEQLCHKAGLPAEAWQDEQASIFYYESLLLKP